MVTVVGFTLFTQTNVASTIMIISQLLMLAALVVEVNQGLDLTQTIAQPLKLVLMI